MNSIYGYYNGENIVPSSRVNLRKNQKVLIMPIDNLDDNYEIIFESIDYEYNKTRYIFNEPYRLTIRKEKENDVSFMYCVEDDSLRIYITEESLEEVIKSFYSWVDILWNEYAVEEDEKLSDYAVLLKNNVNKLIREAIKHD